MIKAYFDGCCEPVNPGGTASYGMVILDDGKEIHRASKIFYPEKGREKETSNNVAEYLGFMNILEWIEEKKLQNEAIEICGDSNLVIHQMFGTWRIKKGFYVPIALKCRKMLSQFPRIKGHWIRRDENSLADELSKAELLKAGIKFKIHPG